jgi:ABC-2 type transport system ATP-binding protein
MLAGLTPPTSGRALVAGRPYRELPNPARLVGVMLDAAAAHPGRTGRETVVIAAALLGLRRADADRMLDRVGLAHAAGRRVGEYSLGMRQRLGIAVALLGDPAALVLDEPANGLDPEGIRWMRELLQDFAARGGTVLLSSHLLTEVQQTVDRLVVIGGGRVVAQGGLDELLTSSGTYVRGLDPVGLAAAIERAGLAITSAADGALVVDATGEQVGRAATAAGQVVVELRANDGAGLEDLFFRLTSSQEDVGVPASAA